MCLLCVCVYMGCAFCWREDYMCTCVHMSDKCRDQEAIIDIFPQVLSTLFVFFFQTESFVHLELSTLG